MKNDSRTLIRKMVGVALLGALSYVFTAFLAIPYAGGAGYFNFGDLVDMIAAMLLGPIEGMCVGIIGGTLADITGGYVMFAPWTLAAKGLLSLVTGLLYHFLKGKGWIKYISPFAGAVFGVVMYIPAYIIIYGAESVMASTPFDCIQCFGSAIITVGVMIPILKIPFFKNVA